MSEPEAVEPSTDVLIDLKIRFFQRVIGGARDLAEMIRGDAEGILEEWFYGYIAYILEIEGIDPDEAFRLREVKEALRDLWDDIRHDAIKYVLSRFADYVERKYGLEGMADRYLFCWSSGQGLMCRLERDAVVRDFDEIATSWFYIFMEDYLDEIVESIAYFLAEHERGGASG